MNTFGNIFRLTTFGESHGEAIGGVVDGMPAGIDIDIDFIQAELNRRRPGQSKITTSRQEADQVELLSGVFEGKSTGCPRMPTTPISRNTASATIVEAGALQRASPSVAAWVVPWLSWCSSNWASACRPIPHR